MTAAITRLLGDEAYDLIYPDYLAKLPDKDRAIMGVAMKASSAVWIGYDDNQVLGCWGVQPPSLLSERAYLWLYVTEHLKDNVFIFIRHSQRAVEAMLQEFSTLYGHTEVHNDRAIRWLKWLGAEFGPEYRGCVPFEIRAKPHG